MHLINLRYLTDLKILPSSSSEVRPPPSCQPVNLHKVKKRLEGSIEARKNQVQALGVNVTPQAQKLFDHIRKLYVIKAIQCTHQTIDDPVGGVKFLLGGGG